MVVSDKHLKFKLLWSYCPLLWIYYLEAAEWIHRGILKRLFHCSTICSSKYLKRSAYSSTEHWLNELLTSITVEYCVSINISWYSLIRKMCLIYLAPKASYSPTVSNLLCVYVCIHLFTQLVLKYCGQEIMAT